MLGPSMVLQCHVTLYFSYFYLIIDFFRQGVIWYFPSPPIRLETNGFVELTRSSSHLRALRAVSRWFPRHRRTSSCPNSIIIDQGRKSQASHQGNVYFFSGWSARSLVGETAVLSGFANNTFEKLVLVFFSDRKLVYVFCWCVFW